MADLGKGRFGMSVVYVSTGAVSVFGPRPCWTSYISGMMAS